LTLSRAFVTADCRRNCRGSGPGRARDRTTDSVAGPEPAAPAPVDPLLGDCSMKKRRVMAPARVADSAVKRTAALRRILLIRADLKGKGARMAGRHTGNQVGSWKAALADAGYAVGGRWARKADALLTTMEGLGGGMDVGPWQIGALPPCLWWLPRPGKPALR